MRVDRFWKMFWIGSSTTTLVGAFLALSLFFYYINEGDLLARVGVSYEAGKDPFENSLLAGAGSAPISVSGGYLYQNSLPLRFSGWTWEASANWRSTEQKKEGTYALKAEFAVPGGTVGTNGPAVATQQMTAITLSVYPDTHVEDLYLNLYDKNGDALQRQSLAWYTPAGALQPNTWQEVSIPLRNLLGTSGATSINGFSISSKKPGLAYIDAVQLNDSNNTHSLWVAPPDTWEAYNPFATSSPLSLPYTFSPTPDSVSRWYTYFGTFGLDPNGDVKVGPKEETKSTGSISVLRGGRSWNNYHIDTTIDWGATSVFSLLSRLTDDGNFVSCAFSRYGESAQLYQVTKGVSTFISQTPPLSVKNFEPWIDVQVGMEVEGDTVSCYIDGARVLKAALPDMSKTGSAGIETWDPNPASSQHTLRVFNVTSITNE